MRAAWTLLLLASCAQAPELEVIDYDFRLTPQPGIDLSALSAAVDEWNRYTDEAHKLSVGDGGWRIETSSTPWRLGALGVTYPSSRVVVIRSDLSWSDHHDVLLHELGHVLGLGHTLSGVMAPVAPVDGVGDEMLTSEDIAECRRVGACAEDKNAYQPH